MNLLSAFKVLPQYQFYISLGLAFIVFLLAICFKKLFRKGIIKLFNNVKFKTPAILESINEALSTPLDYWILITGSYIALLVSPFVRFVNMTSPSLWLSEETQIELALIPVASVHHLYKIALIILLTWVTYNLVGVYEQILLNIGSRFTLLDNTVLIRFTVKVVRFLVIILGLAVLANEIINLTAIITSIGIAGAALTFVAKDTLTNIISGIVLMIDKPFSIGDWVQVAGLEGVVEDVSFRSTRLRTFTQGLVVVPNATLSKDNIINWSAMPKRKVTFDIGLTYNSSKEQLEKCIQDIETLLGNYETVEKNTYLVYFSMFDSSSLNISIAYFSLFTDLKSYAKLKEQINFEIMDIVTQNGLEFAFPTQSVILENNSNQ